MNIVENQKKGNWLELVDYVSKIKGLQQHLCVNCGSGRIYVNGKVMKINRHTTIEQIDEFIKENTVTV
jgi:hypothetical protein